MDIQFDTAAPAQGLMKGFQGGLNAGALIQQERRLKEQQTMQQKAAEQKAAMDKMTVATGMLKQPWATPKYKLELYKQSILPAAQTLGVQVPDLMEWPEVGTEAAKKIHDILTKGQKEGLHPHDMNIMIGEVLMSADEEARKATEPLVKAMKDKGDALAAKEKGDSGRDDRFLQSQVTRFSKQLEDVGVPMAITQFTEIAKHVPPVGTDIPGFGRAGSLPPSWMQSDEGRAARQAVAGLANVIIKDRSGAAVTVPEFVRLAEEIGKGKFKTEKELRQGLQTALNGYRAKLKNVNGGFSPEARAQYYENNNVDDYVKTFEKMAFDSSQGGAPAPSVGQPQKIGRFEVQVMP